ncbi:MAG: hypothetical protein HY075_16160 [Deltaproteobacteria bacterium]|nr:hypothetical protein [Deltaproteobacteria bacterium]
MDKHALPTADAGDEARQYLLDYLVEEFSRYPTVRVRVVPHSEERGVLVRTETREYFFPFEWAERHAFGEVEKQVRVIKDLLDPY